MLYVIYHHIIMTLYPVEIHVYTRLAPVPLQHGIFDGTSSLRDENVGEMCRKTEGSTLLNPLLSPSISTSCPDFFLVLLVETQQKMIEHS